MPAIPRKASDIKLAELTTYGQCSDALESIEMCASNVQGGSKAFFSGKATFLTASAQRKYDAIKAKASKFDDGEDE